MSKKISSKARVRKGKKSWKARVRRKGKNVQKLALEKRQKNKLAKLELGRQKISSQESGKLVKNCTRCLPTNTQT